MKKIIKRIIPYGIIELKEYFRKKKLVELQHERIEIYNNQIENKKILYYNYEKSIEVLVSLGLDEEQIRYGSIPEDSLSFLFKTVDKSLSNFPQIKALHIGNFVGISLTYLSNAFKLINSNCVLVSIDPNLSHRGIRNPQKYVLHLLDRFDFHDMNLVLTGFSLSQNLMDDAGVFYHSELNYKDYPDSHVAPTNILKNLKDIGTQFNFILIDGNHEEKYLYEEIHLCTEILDKNGLLILDDINNGWDDINRVFKKLFADKRFEFLASNDRIGIFKKVV